MSEKGRRPRWLRRQSRVLVRPDDLAEMLEFYASGALTQPTLAAYFRLRQALNGKGSSSAGEQS